MTISISDYSQEHLEAAGWFSGRSIALDGMERELAKLGYEIPALVRNFLVEFGSLDVQTPSPLVQPLFDLKAAEAARALNPEDVAACGALAGASLCPIGSIGQGTYFLLMDEQGRAYAISPFGDQYFLTDTGVALIDALCCGGATFQPIMARAPAEESSSSESSSSEPSSSKAPQDSPQSSRFLSSGSMKLPADVVEKLVKLGWRRGERNTFDRKGLRKIGVECTPRMTEFLETFDGICEYGFSAWAPSSVVFWIWANTMGTNEQHMQDLRELVGARVCPVGSCAFDNLLLFMDEHGRFYSENVYSSEFKILADSEEEFIAGLVGCGSWDHWPFDPETDRWDIEQEKS